MSMEDENEPFKTTRPQDPSLSLLARIKIEKTGFKSIIEPFRLTPSLTLHEYHHFPVFAAQGYALLHHFYHNPNPRSQLRSGCKPHYKQPMRKKRRKEEEEEKQGRKVEESRNEINTNHNANPV